MNSIGANELIIESPLYNTPPEDIGIEQNSRVIRTYLHRLSDLEKDPRLRYTLIYEDYGKPSGKLYGHPHSQIADTPVIPKASRMNLTAQRLIITIKKGVSSVILLL